MNGSIDESWSKAAQIPLMFDFTYQRPSAAVSHAYVASEEKTIDIAFNVKRTVRENSTQTTNGAGVLSDDHVTVALYPLGTQGIGYSFSANALGARYQTSSENSAYSPEWTVVSHRTKDGYVVTMRIPRDIIRSGARRAWKAQFEITTIATNSVDVWAHEAAERYPEDPTYAGSLSGLELSSTIVRPKPRLQVYALGEATGADYGGNTSRVGADLAIPVTATSSLLGTLHPDYSNVETDQQTISPSAYPRQYTEVRPFFTQAVANFNYHYGCTNCPSLLYTPSIPKFRDGFAYTGTQGPLTFAAFQASGADRTDQGETVNYIVSNKAATYSISAQRVAVDGGGFHDDTTSLDLGFGDQRTHTFAYANLANDRGDFVTNAASAGYSEYGVGYASRQTYAVFSLQSVGAQFSPIDGYVAQTDVVGAFSAYSHTFNFSKNDALLDLFVNADVGRYHDHTGSIAQADSGVQASADFRNLFSARVFQSSSAIETSLGELLPFNSNGISIGYKTATSSPASVSISSGAYYHGYLDSYSYLGTEAIRKNIFVSGELDENHYSSGVSTEPSATQWLERVGLDWQLSRFASFDIGARKIVGRNLPNSFQSVAQNLGSCGTVNGYSPFDCVQAGNMSLAFHLLRASNEFYAVYGNPNSLSTQPTLILKWIHYFGAEKGT